jgi:hypothetical protein
MNWFRFAVTISISVLSVAANAAFADKSWQRSSVELVQAKLNDLGYSAGPVDGAWGRKTSSALSLYCEEYDHDCSGGEETVINLLTADTDDSYLDVRMDLASAVWFENRIGYGAPKDRVDVYVGMTRREAVALVITELEDYQDPFELPSWFYDTKPLGRVIQTEIGEACDTDFLKESLKAAWFDALFKSGTPQFDRLATFWLDHFSVAYDAYEHPHAFARHLNFVRKWRAGNFNDLLYAAISDPSTIVYLNNDKSDEATPNENLAREFFELFALGEGNYGEEDVRQFSKLLSGRAFNLADEQYQFMSERAISNSVKVFKSRFSNASDLINSLSTHPAYGRYIATKLYNEYVSLDDPNSRELRRFQKNFTDNNGDIMKLFEDIISSKSFWNLDQQLSLIKSPLDLLAGASRTLNTGGSMQIDRRFWSRVDSELVELNQSIFDPSSIDGWPEGRQWVQGQSIDRRAEALNDLYFLPMTLENELPPVRLDEINHHWEALRGYDVRRKAINTFFASAKPDQLMIEDIVADFDEFDPDRYWVLHVIFKNVRFNDKHYDQIALYFNHAVTNDPPWDRHIKFFRETNSNSFMKKAKFQSDGDTVWFGTLIPFDENDGNYRSLNSDERKIVRGLVSASSAFLTDPGRVGKLDEGGREWLKDILDRDGLFIDIFDPNSNVRLFSTGASTQLPKQISAAETDALAAIPEKKFNRASYHFRFGQPKWLTVEAVFQDVKKVVSDASRSSFSIGFDSNIENDYFHALRLSPGSFRIPPELSYEGQPGYFYVHRHSAENGSFRRLYDSLSSSDQVILRKACEAISDDKMINEMLDSMKQSSQLSLLPADRRDYFDVKDRLPKIKELAGYCVDVTSRIYVSDLNERLELLGYNISKSGLHVWDSQTQTAFQKFLSDHDFPLSTKVSPELFDLIRIKTDRGNNGGRQFRQSSDYFDKEGTLISSSDACEFEIHKSKILIEEFFQYNRVQNLLSSFSSSEQAKEFSKLWFGRPTYGDPGFIANLLPNAINLTDTNAITSIMTSLEYNLR